MSDKQQEELDAIEGQARIIADAQGAADAAQETPPEAEPQPEPQPSAEQQEQACHATAALAAEVIKGYLRGKFADNPRLDEGLKIWDSPMLPAIVVPVLKKYNLSVMSFPPELVLLGGIWKLSTDFASVMRQGAADAAKKATT